MANAGAFLRGMMSAPRTTGAISPSGRRLAKVMAAEVDPSSPGPVVELGPGTGVFTQALIERGVAPERLLLIEFNSAFCKLLADRHPGVRIVQGDAYDFAGLVAAAGIAAPSAIISGLPLLNRPMGARRALINSALELGLPGMPYIQFTYGFGPPVPAGQAYRLVGPKLVWLNFPPATVWVYQRGEAR
jgi:phosphatidylethanolamine/phosphatidyl-N-methylethanolamine N-methyltransferase